MINIQTNVFIRTYFYTIDKSGLFLVIGVREFYSIYHVQKSCGIAFTLKKYFLNLSHLLISFQ